MPYHRTRYEDFILFSTLAAPRIGPAAVVLTGDLVEGKTANTLYQHQYSWEWEAYRNVTSLLKSAVGPSCQVFADLRGNHDSFTVPLRGGPADPYATWGWSSDLVSSRASLRTVVDEDGCDALHVLLLDGTPPVGYRGFMNFMAAWLDPDLVAVEHTLAQARAKAAAQPRGRCGAAPPTLAAVHQPLSVTQSLGRFTRGRADARLTAALAQHGVAALVSGHFHDVGGLRQHVCHTATARACTARATARTARDGLPPEPEACCMLELEAPGWKAPSRHFRFTTFAGGHFAFTDVSFAVHRYQPHAAPALPNTPALTAAPLPSQLPSNFSADCSMRPMDPSALGTPFVVHIAAPPDARYFPTAATLQPWALEDVRVHVLWSYGMHVRDGAAHSHPPELPHPVTAVLSCHAPTSTQQRHWVSTFDLPVDAAQHAAAPWHPVQAGASVPPGTLRRARECRAAQHALSLQVLAAHRELGTAYSERRPIEVEVDAAVPQQPMRTSLIERLAVRPRWPLAMLAAFEGLLAAHMLLLVVAWAARERLGCGKGLDSLGSTNGGIRDAMRDQPSGPAASAAADVAQQAQHAGRAEGRVRTPRTLSWLAALLEALRLLLSAALALPLSVLRMHAVFSHWRRGWWAMLGYLLCVALGPSAAVVPIEGAGVSLIGPYFACLPRSDADMHPPPLNGQPLPILATMQRLWHTCEFQSDAVIFLTAHYVAAIGPMMLWAVSVVARRMQRSKTRPQRAHSAVQAWGARLLDLLTLAPMVFVNLKFLRVVTAVMGWGPLLFGPASGYALPVTLLIVAAGLRRFPVRLSYRRS
eukprot:jgi/Ulvmu1/1349/UM011_0077.1